MFKSCFPNSNLEGRPTDPPAPEEGLTVGYAKHVYNDLLNYFATRPDKLFVVVTAPPVSDAEHAANARAFNTWLVVDWLRENNYPYANVAVFDFYNVLTGPDNHHRFQGGRIEYINDQGGDTAYYPSEDDHPSPDGNRKATEEFVPLLNVFYHRWRAGAPALPTPQVEPPRPPASAAPAPSPVAEARASAGLIDDFESGPPTGTIGWEPFWDLATDTSIACGPAGGAPYSGAAALEATFDVAPASWATCALQYGGAQDWSGGQGISFFVRASEPAGRFDVLLYAGAEPDIETYLTTLETGGGFAAWTPVALAWAQFERVDWEAEAGTPFARPAAVTGLAFGFGTPEERHAGTVWIDDVSLLGQVSAEAPPATASPGETPAEGTPRTTGCRPAPAALPLALAAWAVWKRRSVAG
jgi:hypothetical protein